MTLEQFVSSLSDEQLLALIEILDSDLLNQSELFDVCEYAAELRGLI